MLGLFGPGPSRGVTIDNSDACTRAQPAGGTRRLSASKRGLGLVVARLMTARKLPEAITNNSGSIVNGGRP